MIRSFGHAPIHRQQIPIILPTREVIGQYRDTWTAIGLAGISHATLIGWVIYAAFYGDRDPMSLEEFRLLMFEQMENAGLIFRLDHQLTNEIHEACYALYRCLHTQHEAIMNIANQVPHRPVQGITMRTFLGEDLCLDVEV